MSCHVLGSRRTVLKPTQNPFFIELHEDTSRIQKQFADGVKCIVKSKRSFYLSYFWLVNTTRFYVSLKLPWNEMRHSLLNNNYLEEYCLFKSKEPQFYPLNDDENDLEVNVDIVPDREITFDDLGPLPRSSFPLVVVIFEGDESEEIESDVCAILNVIHIRDSVCVLDTSVIKRFAKSRKGDVLDLRSLFVPNEPSESTSNSTEFATCIICCDSSISQAFLPCRHACVCDNCFVRIDRCPVCRGYIETSFSIDSRPLPQETEETKPNFKEKLMRLFSW